MKEPTEIPVTPNPRTNGFELLSIILTHRKFIVANVFIVSLVALGVSLILPKWYKATASVLPPKQQDLFGAASAASSILKGMPGVARLGGLAQRSSGYSYMAVLKSRSTMEAVVQRFGLIGVYDVEESSLEMAVKELEGNVSFEETDDDNISIVVLDKDAQRAADIANYFIEQLNTISNRLGTQEARSNREFVERRLRDSQRELHRCEDSLKAFQEKSGMIISPEQTAGVSAIASLYGLKTRKEVELAVLRRGTTSDNPTVEQLRIELFELDKKLSTIPQTGLASVRLYRDVIIQQKIVEFLVPLYEQARIDEQKDVPVILVLDKAVAPEKKFKPKRATIVLTATGLSLVFSLIFVFARVKLQDIRDKRPSEYLNVRSLVRDMHQDITFWRRGERQDPR